ncbi:MAG: TIGR00159 family protein [Flavobacteriales bacterium]|nr:TIGR00159 family protein [Flavobacteriales bacterium]
MLNNLLFITLRWLDVVDILLVSIIMYQLYKLVKGTVAIKIFLGILAIYLFWKIAAALKMELLSEILGQFIGVGVIALIVVFQQEIRRFLLLIGNNSMFSAKNRRLFKLLQNNKDEKQELNTPQLISASKNLSQSKTGALIVLDLHSELKIYTNNGEKINAKISSSLLENIFFKNSPLHDGGVIIQHNEIKAARCILPVSDNQSFPSHFGLRHRSAAGITEVSQAIAIIISEETGKISFSKHGEIQHNVSLETLEKLILAEL